MMNRLVFSIVMCLIALTNPIWAEDKLTINDFIITPGVTDKEFSISLDNDISYAAFQFDLYLPEGITITNYNLDSSRLPQSTSLEMNVQPDNSYRFIAVANSLEDISGTNGSIIKLTITAEKSTTLGNLTGYIRNIKLSKANGEGKKYKEEAFQIKVVKPSIITVKNCTRKYGNPNPVFEYSVEGDEIVGTPEIICDATETSGVGTYPININKGSVKNDSVIFVYGTLTIEKATLNIAAGTYTKKQGEPMPEFTLTYTGFKNDESKDVLEKQPTVSCEATKDSEPGEYPVTVSGAEAGNYDITYTQGKLIVTAAEIIVKTDTVTVRANSYTRKYGEENPTFEYTVEEGKLEGTPEISCEANAASPVGKYDIIIRKGSVKNDSVTFVYGTLTVEKAPLNIAAGTYTKKQGEPMPEFTLTYTGFKNDESKDVLEKQPTVSCEATKDSEPGEYPVTVSGAEAGNYDITYTQGKLIVTAAEIIVKTDTVTVRANSYTRKYGEENPTFEYTVEGGKLEGTPEISCEANAASPVGKYDIIIRKGSVKNDSVTFVYGTLTVEKAPLIVTTGNYTREQGQENPIFEINYYGWKNGENEDVLIIKPFASTTATKESPIGDYLITISGGEAQNYEFNYSNGILTVIQANNIDNTIASEKPIKVYTTTGMILNVKSIKQLPRGIYIVDGRKISIR